MRRWMLAPGFLVMVACSTTVIIPTVPTPPPDEGLDLPEPWALPARPTPDPFVSFATGADMPWEERRTELLTLFTHYVYGDGGRTATGGEAAIDSGDFEHGRLHNIVASWEDPAFAITVSVFTPPGEGPFPVFVALNKCGNQSLGPWPEVPITSAFVPSSCPGGAEQRGSRAESWPVAAILDAGWALATVHQNELAPDDRELAFEEGLLPRGAPGADPRSNWGAIAVWAWGLSRALDSLEAALPSIDPFRAVPVGHSRRGKSALLAAARDERFAGAIAHQSGTGGVTLSRSDGGESVASITQVFPHWFAPRFADFADLEDRLPVDQHLLVALVAPRPFLATDGDEDDWADPAGARESIERAAPVWDHYGAGGLMTDDGAPTLDGDLAWGTRPGGHSLEAQDWERFLSWVAVVGL